MRNVHELLKEKETELQRVTQEVEALRLVVRLMAETANDSSRAAAAGMDKFQPGQPPRMKVFP
jgi:hypothetical protein